MFKSSETQTMRAKACAILCQDTPATIREPPKSCSHCAAGYCDKYSAETSRRNPRCTEIIRVASRGGLKTSGATVEEFQRLGRDLLHKALEIYWRYQPT